MMANCKYNVGDKLGLYQILFEERTHRDNEGHWFGIFSCSFCGKKFEGSVSSVASGKKISCGCQINPFKYNAGDKVSPYRQK